MKIAHLPDILENVKNVEEWEQRRKHLWQTVMETEYGIRPDLPYETSFALTDADEEAVDGTAVRKTYEITVKTELGEWKYPLYVWIPKSEEKVPLNLFLSVRKRESVPMALPEGVTMESLMAQMMPLIRHPERSMPQEMPSANPPFYMDKNIDMEYWPVRMCLNEKIAMAGIYIDDVELDNPAAFPSGLASLFSTKERSENEWGAISVWAFGASIALDCLLEHDEFDPEHISVTGHSRAGKAAIVAALNDTRFTRTFSNESGCCGSAISREKEGENITTIQMSFPHWFAPKFKEYAQNEDALPFDQHTVLALLAPRKLYVASGDTDCWSGPAWEYEGIRQASKVWELYGEKSLFTEEMPNVNEPIEQVSLAYHRREGGHDLRRYDWEQFMKYSR